MIALTSRSAQPILPKSAAESVREPVCERRSGCRLQKVLTIHGGLVGMA